jgi:hypothetical protein
MAYITFRGGTKEQKKLAKSLAEFCLDKLISSRLSNTLDIRIVFKPKLYKKTDSYGETTYYEDSNIPPKDFLIEIDSKLKMRSMLETIAHELVHVKQWATGEMRETKDNFITKFKKDIINSNKVSYWDQPWEIEAMGREEGLFIQWIEKMNLSGQTWTKRKYF